MPDGLDPNISLGVRPPQMDTSMGLGPVATFAEVQNRLNANQLFQRQFQARMRLGQIMSGPGSIEDKLNQAAQDPIAGPYSGEYFNQMRESMLALTKMQGEQLNQNENAYSAVLKGMAGSMNDPTLFAPLVRSHLMNMPDAIRARVMGPVGDLAGSLTSGLPMDKPISQWTPDQVQLYRNRFQGVALASGMKPEDIRNATGQMAPGLQIIQTPTGALTVQTGTQPLGVGGAPGLAPGPANANQLTGAPAPSGGAPPDPWAGSPRVATAQPMAPQRGPGGTLILGAGPSPEAEATAKEQARISGDVIEEQHTNMATSLPIMQKIDKLTSLMGGPDGFLAGGGAEWRARLAQKVQALRNVGFPGISNDFIKSIGNESLSGTQLFKTLIQQFATRQLSTDARGQGKTMLPEVRAYLENMSEDLDPTALVGYLNMVKQLEQLYYNKAVRFNDYQQKGYAPWAYDTVYNQKYGFEDQKSSIQPPPGVSFEPTPISAVKTGAPELPDRGPDLSQYESLKDLTAAVTSKKVDYDKAVAYARSKKWIK